MSVMLCFPPQVEEHEDIEADSVTKLHQDMSDACNILVHCQRGRDEEAAAPPPRCGMEPAVRGSRWDKEGSHVLHTNRQPPLSHTTHVLRKSLE